MEETESIFRLRSSDFSHLTSVISFPTSDFSSPSLRASSYDLTYLSAIARNLKLFLGSRYLYLAILICNSFLELK